MGGNTQQYQVNNQVNQFIGSFLVGPAQMETNKSRTTGWLSNALAAAKAATCESYVCVWVLIRQTVCVKDIQ